MNRAPVQGQAGPPPRRRPKGTITWTEHLEVWEGYRRRFPWSAAQQDAARIAERHGFGYWEAAEYLGHELTTWEPR